MRLIVPILLNCILVLAVYLVDKYTPAKKMPYMAKQIIIGILFGGVSAFASSYGVNMLGTVVNVRDAAPLSAGLILVHPPVLSPVLLADFTAGSLCIGVQEFTRNLLAVLPLFLRVLWRQDLEN